MTSCKYSIPFIVFSLVIAVILLGVLIANIIYFVKLSSGETIPQGEISSMIWISAISLAFVVAVIGWATYVLISCFRFEHYKTKISEKLEDVKSSFSEFSSRKSKSDDLYLS